MHLHGRRRRHRRRLRAHPLPRPQRRRPHRRPRLHPLPGTEISPEEITVSMYSSLLLAPKYVMSSRGCRSGPRSRRIWRLGRWCSSRTTRSWCSGSPTTSHSARACSVWSSTVRSTTRWGGSTVGMGFVWSSTHFFLAHLLSVAETEKGQNYCLCWDVWFLSSFE